MNFAEFISDKDLQTYADVSRVGYRRHVLASRQTTIPIVIARRWNCLERKVEIEDKNTYAVIAPAIKPYNSQTHFYSRVAQDSQFMLPSALRKRWFGAGEPPHGVLELADLGNSMAIMPEGSMLARMKRLAPHLGETAITHLTEEIFSSDHSALRQVVIAGLVKQALEIEEQTSVTLSEAA